MAGTPRDSTGVENAQIYVMCGRTNNFGQMIQAIGNATIPVEKRLERLSTGGSFNFSVGGFGVGMSDPTNQHTGSHARSKT